MKFFVTNDLKKEKSLRHMIVGLLIFLSLFTLSDILVKASLFGTNPSEAVKVLQGDSESFIEPYAYESLLEMLHTDLFFAMMLFMLSGALYFRVKTKNTFSSSVMVILLFTLIVSMSAPFLALFYTFGVYLWYYAFIIWHIIFIIIFADIIFTLIDATDA